MPKLNTYKTNSVVYFTGDIDNRVFLLNEGHVALTYTDIQTGKRVVEDIKKGEFFGMKSALGNFPREEDAIVLKDSLIYVFTDVEFENFAKSNSRITLQMIKVFSRQLRAIHRKIESVTESSEYKNPEEGLFETINIFYKAHNFLQAAQIAQRYKHLYPTGNHAAEVDKIFKAAKRQADAEKPQIENTADIDLLDRAEAFAKSGNWHEAYQTYDSIILQGTSPDLEAAYIGAGKSLFKTGEYAHVLTLLTKFITNCPSSKKIGEALLYMGESYLAMGYPKKALSFAQKAQQLIEPALKDNVQTLIAACGEK